MYGYSKTLLLTDVSLLLISAFLTYCLQLTLILQDDILSGFFRFMVYIIDIAIMLAIQVSMDMKDGTVVFTFFRILGLVFAEGFGVGEIVFWPGVGFMVFRIGGIVVNKYTGLSEVDPKATYVKQQWKTMEGQRRQYFIAILSFISYFTVFMCTYHRYNSLPLLLTMLFFSALIYQLYFLQKSQNYLARLISNTFHLNIVLYFLICTISGQYFHQKWYFYYQPCIIYLAMGVAVIRVFIGSQSWKYHKGDRQLFAAVYSFSSEIVSKRYRNHKKQEWILKCSDRISRQLSQFTYFLGCTVVSQGGEWYWLAIGVFITLHYQVENNQDNPFFFLQQKIQIKLRSQILFPFLFLAWSVHTRSLCQKQLIFQIVSGCDSYVKAQFWFTIGLVTTIWMGQWLPSKSLRLQLYKAIAFVAPLLVLLMVVGLECQNVQLSLMSLYGIVLIFQIIRDERITVSKSSKKQ